MKVWEKNGTKAIISLLIAIS